MLSVFDGGDPNGTWTLFIADTSPGGISTLVSWGMQIATVPEPGSAALLVGGLALLLVRRSLSHRS